MSVVNDIPPLTVKYIDITFLKPFSQPPVVNATLYTVLESAYPYRISIYNVTETGFRLYAYNAWSGGYTAVYVEWIAVGN